MLTLQEFLGVGTEVRNAYVRFPGLRSLYVRKGPYWIDDAIVLNTVQIASVESHRPGHGEFRVLIDWLAMEYPELTIIVECVLLATFVDVLNHMQFERINLSTGYHFVKWPKDGKD